MRIIPSVLRGQIRSSDGTEWYDLPEEIVSRIAELERLAADRAAARTPKYLDARRKELGALRTLVDRAAADIAQTESEILRAATNCTDTRSPLNAWDCHESPLGRCVYDLATDPYCDHCLFCNEPEERK